jgi:hypothetical protein
MTSMSVVNGMHSYIRGLMTEAMWSSSKMRWEKKEDFLLEEGGEDNAGVGLQDLRRRV